MAASLLQSWAFLVQGDPELGYFGEVYGELKRSGVKFPSNTSSETGSAGGNFFIQAAAPSEWTDSSMCSRCRSLFNLLNNRKHHCRQCGRSFCGQCSSRTIPLPYLGLDQPVRVCEGCWTDRTSAALDTNISVKPAPSVEDEDLARAIQLSLQAEEEEGSSKPLSRSTSGVTNRKRQAREPNGKADPKDEEEEERMLAAAIAASLQDQQTRSAINSSQSHFYPTAKAPPSLSSEEPSKQPLNFPHSATAYANHHHQILSNIQSNSQNTLATNITNTPLNTIPTQLSGFTSISNYVPVPNLPSAIPYAASAVNPNVQTSIAIPSANSNNPLSFQNSHLFQPAPLSHDPSARIMIPPSLEPLGGYVPHQQPNAIKGTLSHSSATVNFSPQKTLADSAPAPPQRAPSPPPISQIERENVFLFAQLIQHTSLTLKTSEDEELQELATEMRRLRDRLRRQIESGRLFASTGTFTVKYSFVTFADIKKVLASLNEALSRYEQLAEVDKKPANLTDAKSNVLKDKVSVTDNKSLNGSAEKTPAGLLLDIPDSDLVTTKDKEGKSEELLIEL